IAVKYPNGNRELFIYDPANPSRRSQGNLLDDCRYPGPLHGDQFLICTQYEYEQDMGGCCGSNFVKRETDALGQVTEYTYDAAGNRIHATYRIPAIVEDYEYDGQGRMTAHTYPDNGSGHRRRDGMTFYTGGPQDGYLHTQTVDAGG